jgi:hypothetical protein
MTAVRLVRIVGIPLWGADIATGSRWMLQQLPRQMACDRPPERRYLVNEGWPDGPAAFFGAFKACAYPFLKCRI